MSVKLLLVSSLQLKFFEIRANFILSYLPWRCHWTTIFQSGLGWMSYVL